MDTRAGAHEAAAVALETAGAAAGAHGGGGGAAGAGRRASGGASPDAVLHAIAVREHRAVDARWMLQLRPGDAVVVTERVGHGKLWWKGFRVGAPQVVGLFPASHVTAYAAAEAAGAGSWWATAAAAAAAGGGGAGGGVDGGGAGAAEFDLLPLPPPFEYCVVRRFNDFRRLHRELRRLVPALNDVLPKLPAKDGLFGYMKRFDPEVVQRRKAAFNRMLRLVIRDPEIANTAPVREFFKQDT
jgi:hypothetical protein